MGRMQAGGTCSGLKVLPMCWKCTGGTSGESEAILRHFRCARSGLEVGCRHFWSVGIGTDVLLVGGKQVRGTSGGPEMGWRHFREAESTSSWPDALTVHRKCTGGTCGRPEALPHTGSALLALSVSRKWAGRTSGGPEVKRRHFQRAGSGLEALPVCRKLDGGTSGVLEAGWRRFWCAKSGWSTFGVPEVGQSHFRWAKIAPEALLVSWKRAGGTSSGLEAAQRLFWWYGSGLEALPVGQRLFWCA